MTLLNFPPTTNAPTDGSFTYTANGVVYAWDGEKWTANSQEGLDNSYVNIDGDTMTGDLTVPSLNGGPLAGFRNHIINGDFRVWQRGIGGATPTPPPNAVRYYSDRWASYKQTGAANNDVQRVIDAPAEISSGFCTSLKSADLRQVIEDGAKLFSVGSTWTLSYWIKGFSGASGQVLTQTGFCKDVQTLPGEFTEIIAETDSVGSDWKKITKTFTITSTGAADQIHALVRVSPDFFALVTGVQLEPGPVATPFEHRPIGTELALCRRYYQETGTLIMFRQGFSSATTSSGVGCNYTFVPAMRAAPTETVASSTNVSNLGVIMNNGDGMRVVGNGTSTSSSASVSYNLDAEL